MNLAATICLAPMVATWRGSPPAQGFVLLMVVAAAVLWPPAPAALAAEPARPLIFAHRGASGERPEHTLAAYRLAMEQGADYVEPDLRRSKDGVIIALHDTTLNRTTDVAAHPGFADRAHPDKTGAPIWVPADFTIAELRTLRCKQGHAGRSKAFDGREPIPTLAEIVELVRAWNREHHANVGIIPELRGDAADFIAFARKHKLGEAGSPPIYLQSFEAGPLRAAREALHFPSALLTSDRPDIAKVRELQGVFDAIAIGKAGCLKDDSQAWVAQVHALGLQVIAWSFDDASYDKSRFASSQAEIERVFTIGTDAVFADFPATAAKARSASR